MLAQPVKIVHGPVVMVAGKLPSTAPSLLTRAGAFEKDGAWFCTAPQWPRVEVLLKSLGVPMQVEGVPVAEAVPESAQKSCYVTFTQAGDVRIQGPLPRYVPKYWLGQERHNGYVGMSPLALADFIKACQEENITVRFDESTAALRDETLAMMIRIDMTLQQKRKVDVPLRQDALLDYQQEAIAFAEAAGGRFLVHYDVGTGKTLIGIGWHRHSRSRRTLVICPSIAKGNWKDEIAKFDGGTVAIVDGFRRGMQPLPATSWVILSMDVVMDYGHNKGWLQAIKEWGPDFIIMDESHNIRGADTQRAEGVRAACKLSKHAMLATGTAMSEGSIDLWPQLDALQPGWWGTYFSFGIAFANGKKRWRRTARKSWEYWDMSGSSNTDVLSRRLRYAMIRKTLEDTGLKLPPQTRMPLLVNLTPTARHQYDEAVAEYRKLIEAAQGAEDDGQRFSIMESTKAKRMVLVGKMRQISSMGRVAATMEWILKLAAQGKRPIVFGFFTAPLKALYIGLTQAGLRVGYIDGSTSRPRRDAVKQGFLARDLDVLVGQIEAMGVAINLQDGSNVTVNHDITYRPLDIIQCEGRIWRKGQKDPVTHYYCMGIDTKDDRAFDIVLKKMANVKAVHAGVDVTGEVAKAIESDFFSSPSHPETRQTVL